MKLAAVLFDLDGTLVDSLQDLQDSVNYILQAYGRPPLARDVVRSYIGDGVKVLLSRSFLGRENPSPPAASGAEKEGGGRTWQEIELARKTAIDALLIEARGMTRPTLAEAMNAFRAYYAEHLADTSALYPGASDALADLARRGIGLGVVTNKPEHHSEKMLAALKARQWFRVVVGGDTLPVTKPDPLPLFHAMKAMGAEPGATLMVGDSGNDILAGRSAGCRTAAVAFGFNDPALLHKYQPDWMLEDFPGLLEAISK